MENGDALYMNHMDRRGSVEYAACITMGRNARSVGEEIANE